MDIPLRPWTRVPSFGQSLAQAPRRVWRRPSRAIPLAPDASSAFGLEQQLFNLASQANEMVTTGLTSNTSLLAPLLFIGGVASSLNPCNMASLPAAVTSVTALSRRSSPAFAALSYAAGSATVLMALGMAVSVAGERLPLGEGLLPWVFPTVAVLMGLSLLEVVPLRLSGIPGLGKAIEAPRELQGFLLGAASAAGSSPCATPVLVTITSYIASHSVSVTSSALLLFAYSMGYSTPLALVSMTTGLLPMFQEGGQWGKQVSGAAILLVGAWQLLTAVHDTLGLEAEAAVYVLLAAAALAWKPAASRAPRAASLAPRVMALGQAVYEYQPLPAGEAQAEAPSSPGEPDGRRLAVTSLLGAAAVAGLSQFPGETEDAATMIVEAAAESRPLQVALQSGKPVLVDFSATWCVDCLQSAGILRDLKREFGGRVEFVTLDVSNWRANTGDDDLDWWTREFRVDGIPHIAFVLPDRRVITALIGDLPDSVLRANVEALSELGASSALPALPFVMFDAFDEGRRRVQLRA
ncbi:unnamed protein product [Effrenium voratum]|nr:unnamed protein product [Effrenium voratum]